MEVRGNGDCREATFEGDPASLGIGPRDTVQVQYRADPSRPWKSRYAGTIVVNGSSRSELGRYKLQGLRYKRLTEVEARTLLTEADLGAQVRQLFADLIASGQLGQTLGPPTAASIPDLNITSAAIHGNYWKVAKLIDERLKGRSRHTRSFLLADGSTENRDENPDWGVNADLVPVFGYPGGLLEIDEAQEGVEIDGLDLDSTTLVTDVRLMWTRTLSALRLTATRESRDNPRDAVTAWAEDLKAASPLTLAVPVAPRTFGEAWRSLPLPADANLFRPLVPQGVTVFTSSYVTKTGTEAGDPLVEGDPSVLWDGRGDTSLTLTAGSGVLAATYAVILNYPDDTPLPDGLLLTVEGAAVAGVNVLANAAAPPRWGITVRAEQPSSPSAPLYLFPGVTRDQRLAPHWEAGKQLVIFVEQTDVRTPVRITAACLAHADPALARAAATPLARTPTLNPVTARIPGWDVEPAGAARLTLRDPLGAVVEVRELPVELIVYDIDDDGEMYSEVRCGQRDDAEALSFSSAIEQRDQVATVDAVRASA